MTYLVFDVETTGLPKNYNISPKVYKLWPNIVQFSWITNNKEKTYYIKPEGYSIPVESTKIHGVTNKYALKHGVSLEYALRAFKDDCEKVNYLVAHNASFDKNIILAALYRSNQDPSFLQTKNIICTMKSTTHLCKLPGKYNNYKYPKLEELYMFLFKEKPNVKLHDSLEDSRVTLKCYKELLKKKLWSK